MKHILSGFFILCIFYTTSFSQKKKLYDVNANPVEQFNKAIKNAKLNNKHVMIQIGGNWCSWCYKFHDFYENDTELDSLLKSNYIVININYNKKSANDSFFKQLGYPQRFGFPVIVITDANGKRLHTQNSWYLEDGKSSYDKKKFKSFLKNWTVEAVSDRTYK